MYIRHRLIINFRDNMLFKLYYNEKNLISQYLKKIE